MGSFEEAMLTRNLGRMCSFVEVLKSCTNHSRFLNKPLRPLSLVRCLESVLLGCFGGKEL